MPLLLTGENRYATDENRHRRRLMHTSEYKKGHTFVGDYKYGHANIWKDGINTKCTCRSLSSSVLYWDSLSCFVHTWSYVYCHTLLLTGTYPTFFICPYILLNCRNLSTHALPCTDSHICLPIVPQILPFMCFPQLSPILCTYLIITAPVCRHLYHVPIWMEYMELKQTVCEQDIQINFIYVWGFRTQ